MGSEASKLRIPAVFANHNVVYPLAPKTVLAGGTIASLTRPHAHAAIKADHLSVQFYVFNDVLSQKRIVRWLISDS